MENVFDALCSALNEPAIKNLFLASEGIDLMVLMMKYVCKTNLHHIFSRDT
jgi:beta-catenin-like protein 1